MQTPKIVKRRAQPIKLATASHRGHKNLFSEDASIFAPGLTLLLLFIFSQDEEDEGGDGGPKVFNHAHSSSSQFAVLDYARLSAQPPTRLGRATGERREKCGA